MRARVVNRRWLWPLVGVAAFVIACLLLGWWQWDRSQSAGGTLRNLAYALEWPSFAAFAIYMLYRAVVLERTKTDAEAPGAEHDPAESTTDPMPSAARAADPVTRTKSLADNESRPAGEPAVDSRTAGPEPAPAATTTPSARRAGWWLGAAARLGHRADDAPVGPVRIGPPRPAEPDDPASEDARPADGEDADGAESARTVWNARHPAEPDDELASYNQYLARLHAADQRNPRDRAV